MGLFDKLLGGKSDLPELDANSPVAEQLQAIEEPLRSLMQQIKDPLEVVPAEGRTYVFVGKPPKRFGVAWIENGELVNFQILAQEHGLKPAELQNMIDQIGDAYRHYEDAQRFAANVAGREIVVTPSPQLKQDVQAIVGSAIN